MSMLTNQELREMSQVDGRRTVLYLVSDWLMIASLFALVIYVPHPATFLFAFFIMGRQQLALAVLMHDAAHRRFFKSPWWNDVVAQWFVAGPLYFSLFSYRSLHLKHHQNPLASDDPDLTLTAGYPTTKKSFCRKILRDLFLISYFKFIKYFLHMSRRRQNSSTDQSTSSAKTTREPMPMTFIVTSIVFSNVILLSLLYSLGHGWLYLFLWFLPMATVLQFYLRIRGITEHSGYKPNENQMVNARTVINPVQTWIFAPHNVNYHIEHHVYPSVPCFRLPKLHDKIKSELPPANVYSGYGKVLRELVQ